MPPHVTPPPPPPPPVHHHHPQSSTRGKVREMGETKIRSAWRSERCQGGKGRESGKRAAGEEARGRGARGGCEGVKEGLSAGG